MPAKTEITETVTMGEAQRAIYEGIRLAMHAKVRAAVARRGVADSGIVILDALLKLRQACCDPQLLKLSAAKAAKAQSAKLERLFELLLPLLEEGRCVLLFSQFTSMLALVEAELVRLSLPYVLLTGDTRDRDDPVGRFQSGAVPLFLISLKAGGVGLNLTAADTVIHYDPWWNPAVENQATDRAHRIGQDKPVFVHRLITAETVEEKMQVLKGRKQALADGIRLVEITTPRDLIVHNQSPAANFCRSGHYHRERADQAVSCRMPFIPWGLLAELTRELSERRIGADMLLHQSSSQGA